MSSRRPVDIVLSQLRIAKHELDNYPPHGFGWHKRCVESTRLLVPWLTETAPDLKAFVEEVVNSKQLVRETWKTIKHTAGKNIPTKLLATMDRELDREAVLLTTVGGDVMSKVIEKFLIDNFPGGHLESNGRSDYPDLFIRTKNYEGLPTFASKSKSKKYGAALKGKTKRPVRVPDGLEIKTCKNRFAVDCHHAHSGLHLVLLFQGRTGSVDVEDIMVAFMRHGDYRITQPNSPTTTLKASFNGKNFVSLIHG